MPAGDRERWDKRWSQAGPVGEPPRILRDHGHLLPTTGDALEIACGLGAGALWLAQSGLRVQAWDVSPVAVERLAAEAARRAVSLEALVRDVVEAPPEPASVDVLLVTRFLDRALLPALRSALRPGGLLLLQTFWGPRIERGPRRDAWRLRAGELPEIAAELEVLVAEEGDDEEAVLIARRRP